MLLSSTPHWTAMLEKVTSDVMGGADGAELRMESRMKNE